MEATNVYRQGSQATKDKEAARRAPLIKKGGKYYERILATNRAAYQRNKKWFLARNKLRLKTHRTPIALVHRYASAKFYIDCPAGKVVDHIVPIRGIHPVTRGHVVSGLHVPWNLRHIKPNANAQKWAWFDPNTYKG